MATLTGLFQRGSSYYLRVILPVQHPMRRQYKNGEFVTSLGRCTLREAKTKGTIKRAEVLTGCVTHEARSPTVIGTQVQSAAPATFLREIFDLWTKSKPRSADTVSACLHAIALYEEFTDNPPITQLTRSQGDGFRAWLQLPARNTTSKTAHDRLTWVKSVLKYASRDLGLIERNPWEVIDISFKTTNKRRPWTDDELKKCFTHGPYPDFHCLRHTVRSQMADADVPEQVIDTLLGHEVKGSTGAKVYTHRTLLTLRKAIEVLDYSALALPRVYRASP